MAASSAGFLTAIIIDIVVCLIAFLAFSVLRIASSSRNYYAPKSFTPGLQNKPKDLPYTWASLLGWMWPIITYKEPDIITSAGLDTAIYLRVLSFGFELFLYSSALCLVVMLPVNLTASNIDDLQSGSSNSSDNFKFSEFDKCGLANVETSSNRMWAHMLCVYGVTFIALWLLYKYSKESVLLRIMFIANSRKGRSSHTVLVTDIPAVASYTSKRLPSIKEERKSMSNRKLLEERKSPHSKTAKNVEGMTSTSTPAAAGGEGPPAGAEGQTAGGSGGDRHSAGGGEIAAAGWSKTPVEGTRTSPSHVAIGHLEPGEGGDGSQRKGARKTFTYDLKDESLNPHVMAEKLISSGLSPKGLVEKEFNDVYPNGAVETVQMICDQSALDPLVEEYNKLKLQLEDLLDEAEHRFSTGKEVKRAMKFILPLTMGKWGTDKYGYALIKKVDALEFFIARLRELDFLIDQERPLSSSSIWPSAFVTFRSRQDQACATTSLHHHDTAVWLVHPAAEPEELLWSNLGMVLPMRSSRNLLMWVAFWLMCFFFMIPVGFVQALIEAPTLASNPVLGPFVGNPVIGKLLEGILPGLALKIFLILVPAILTAMIKFSGATSLADVDMGIVSRYFVFQVIVVFFGSVIMGSFFNQVEQWIQDPASVISVLGTAIPMVSTFFITYIAVNGLLVKPIAFIRIVGLIIYWLLAKLSGSPRARDRLWQEQKTTLGTTVVDHTITILLGLVYSCINPIITPFCLTYFAVNLVIERYQNIYVVTRDYESSGKLWPKVFSQVLVALYIMQLTMLGLLGIKKFPFTVILIPLLLITLAFHIICLGIFSKPWHLMSLHDAADLDRYEHEAPEAVPLLKADVEGAPGVSTGPVAAQAGLEGQVFLSPVFKVVPGAIEDLLSQASRMILRIDGAAEAKGAEEESVSQEGNV